MRSKPVNYLFAILGCTAVLIPCLSWVLSAFGFPVRSLLGEVGWRWLFVHGMDSMVNHWVILFMCICSAFGALQYSGILQDKLSSSRNGFYAVSILTAIFLAFFVFFSLYPQSPLLSITGGLLPSPLLWGFPCALCIHIILVSLVFGLFSSKLQGLDDLCALITFGLSKYSTWIACSMLLSFQIQCLRFVFNTL